MQKNLMYVMYLLIMEIQILKFFPENKVEDVKIMNKTTLR